jgi:hypothetical protein
LFQHLVAIHFDKLLRNARQESSAEAGDFRPLSGSIKKSTQVFGQELKIAARTVLEYEGESARGADAWNGGRRKPKATAAGNLLNSLVEMRLERLKLLGLVLRSSQGLKFTKKVEL